LSGCCASFAFCTNGCSNNFLYFGLWVSSLFKHVFTKSLQLFERRSTVSCKGGPSTICCNWSNTDVHSRNGKYPVEIS